MLTKFIFYIITFFIISNFVFAINDLDSIFNNLSNIGLFYSIDNNPFLWDALLFIPVFIVLGKFIFKKQFSGKIGGVIGFALSIIMISGEITLNFSVTKEFGPWFLIAGVAFLLFSLLKLIIHGKDKKGPISLSIFLFLTIMLNGFGTFNDFILNKSSLLYSFLVLIQTLSMVFAFIWIFKQISNIGKGNSPNPEPNDPQPNDPINPTPDEPTEPINENELLKLINDFKSKLQDYENKINQYKIMTDDLISKIRQQLSADAGYFDHPSIEFDWRRYHNLIEEIIKIEDYLLRIIEEINNKTGWQGTQFEEQIKQLIIKFENLMLKRKSIKNSLQNNYENFGIEGYENG
jgi:hypothetical protein